MAIAHVDYNLLREAIISTLRNSSYLAGKVLPTNIVEGYYSGEDFTFPLIGINVVGVDSLCDTNITGGRAAVLVTIYDDYQTAARVYDVAHSVVDTFLFPFAGVISGKGYSIATVGKRILSLTLVGNMRVLPIEFEMFIAHT